MFPEYRLEDLPAGCSSGYAVPADQVTLKIIIRILGLVIHGESDQHMIIDHFRAYLGCPVEIFMKGGCRQIRSGYHRTIGKCAVNRASSMAMDKYYLFHCYGFYCF